MRIVQLNADWRLYPFPPGSPMIETPGELSGSGIAPVQATVPGNVELDLQAAGLLPEDLFFSDRLRAARELELYDWWYVGAFETPPGTADRPVTLKFKGVDCLAQYWLNGEPIGASDNMLIEASFEVGGKLRSSGLNELAVRISSPLRHAMEQTYGPGMAAQPTNWERLHVRKAGHMYGWDIMPRALSAGIWRGIELVMREGEAEFDELYFYTRALSADRERAEVGVYYRLKGEPGLFVAGDLRLKVSGVCGDAAFESEHIVAFAAGRADFAVASPQLWWPAGYGEARLYALTVTLTQAGRVVAARTERVGIRLAKLLRSEVTTPEESGQFLLKINGEPIMAKGSNWVTLDVFHSRDAAKYETAVGMLADLGCNIVRCWGGGVYEDDAFFRLCDERGLMVWQDFAMACEVAPQSADFAGKLEREATAVALRLRNRPSLVLWCGDNECDEAYGWHGLGDPGANRLTRELVPAVLRLHDPFRDYLPSSPYLAPRAVVSGDARLAPERHLWGPRNFFRSRYYETNEPHFISEIGFQGMPNLSSMRRFLPSERLWPWRNNADWIAHCTDSTGPDGPYAYRVELISDEIAEMFGHVPDEIGDFIAGSQIQQAEALKHFIELTRLRKWRRSGIIWWNLLDGWPQFSDAVVDYYLSKKLAYYYIRRSQRPVCLMIDNPEQWRVRLVAGNDSLEAAEGDYRVRDGENGETLLEGRFYAKANENAELGSIRLTFGEKRLLLIEWTIDGRKYGNHYVHGYPIFSLDAYKGWLAKIAALEGEFDAAALGE